MLVEERRQRVLDVLQRQGFLTLTALAEELAVSVSTLRRDLEHWQRLGLLKRVHGGAMFVGDGQALPSLEERSGRQMAEKQAIARLAAARVHDGDAVLLDGGTTTLEVARLLVGRPIQVVTNSLPIAHLFVNAHETDLVILGGYVYSKTGVALGPFTVKMLHDVHVHQAIMSCSGLSSRGLFNSNLLLVETQRQMMKCADEVVIVADHTKIGRQALAFLCELSAIDVLITDSALNSEQRAVLEHAGPRLIVAGESNNGEDFSS